MYDERYMGKKRKSEGNAIVDILIERDGMTPNEAWTYFEECQNEFMENLESGEIDPWTDGDEALKDYFGLEPDYLMDFLPNT